MMGLGDYVWPVIAPIVLVIYVVLAAGPALTTWGLKSGTTLVTLAGVAIVALFAGLFILCQVHRKRNEAKAMNYRLTHPLE